MNLWFMAVTLTSERQNVIFESYFGQVFCQVHSHFPDVFECLEAHQFLVLKQN